jgi:hypothetical protein
MMTHVYNDHYETFKKSLNNDMIGKLPTKWMNLYKEEVENRANS